MAQPAVRISAWVAVIPRPCKGSLAARRSEISITTQKVPPGATRRRTRSRTADAVEDGGFVVDPQVDQGDDRVRRFRQDTEVVGGDVYAGTGS